MFEASSLFKFTSRSAGNIAIPANDTQSNFGVAVHVLFAKYLLFFSSGVFDEEVVFMESDQISDLNLRRLEAGAPALTPEFGAVLAQCAAVSLEDCMHSDGAVMTVSGDFTSQCRLRWRAATDQTRRCFNDVEVATEHGAYGIAILLLRDLMGYTIVERSRKGTGFDYWLGHEADLPFQNKARLEVSGSRSEKSKAVKSRVNRKIKQTDRSDNTGTPAIVAVVGFRDPCAQVVKK